MVSVDRSVEMKSDVNELDDIEVVDEPNQAYARVRIHERSAGEYAKCSVFLGSRQLLKLADACREAAKELLGLEGLVGDEFHTDDVWSVVSPRAGAHLVRRCQVPGGWLYQVSSDRWRFATDLGRVLVDMGWSPPQFVPYATSPVARILK